MYLPNLIVGHKYTNNELCEIFSCSPQGGMRRSLKTNTLVLIHNLSSIIYADEWKYDDKHQKDILHYTGMGLTGDQTLDGNQNKTLARSRENGVSVFLFEVFKEKEYTFTGEVILAGNYYTDIQPDHNKTPRKVYIFPLQIKENNQTPRKIPMARLVDKSDIDQIYHSHEKSLKKKSAEELFQHIINKKNNINEQITIVSRSYVRNVYVAEYAKKLANGICQLCLTPAPFKVEGQPYLECHHIEWLSRGGSDTIDNVVALCANCHRKMHLIDDKKDIQTLMQLVKSRPPIN